MSQPTKIRIITRNILLLSLVSFFTDMSSEMLYPVMPLFFTSLGLGALSIGLIEGSAETVAGLSKSFFGHLGDQLGRPEWFVRLGYGLSALSKPLLGLVNGIAAFVAIRSSDRLGKGIRTASRDAILADESVASARGRIFGFHRFFDTLGAAVGPLIAVVLIASLNLYHDLGKIFVFALFPGIAAVILTFLVRSKLKKSFINRAALIATIRSYPAIFRPSRYTTRYKKLLLGLVLVGLFNSSDVFLLLRASQLVGAQQSFFGIVLNNAIMVILLYVLYNVAYAVLSLVTGAAADKLGFRNTFIGGLMAFAVTYGLLGQDLSIFGVIAAFIVYGLFSAANDAVAKAWVSKQLPKSTMGTGIGVANTVISVTFLVSSVITGWLWQTFSAGLALSTLSIGMIVPIAYLLFVMPAQEAEYE